MTLTTSHLIFGAYTVCVFLIGALWQIIGAKFGSKNPEPGSLEWNQREGLMPKSPSETNSREGEAKARQQRAREKLTSGDEKPLTGSPWQGGTLDEWEDTVYDNSPHVTAIPSLGYSREAVEKRRRQRGKETLAQATGIDKVCCLSEPPQWDAGTSSYIGLVCEDCPWLKRTITSATNGPIAKFVCPECKQAQGTPHKPTCSELPFPHRAPL